MANNKFKSKTAAQFRDDFLRTLKNGLIQLGIDNPDISFGTEYYVLGETIGKIAEQASYNAIVAADAQMADTATGEDLYRIAAIYKLALKPASGSSGFLVFDTSNSSAVISGSQLIDPSGLRYEVAIGQLYANGDLIPINAIDTGTSTNLTSGTQLRWVSPPPFSSPTALVSTGGLTGGVNAEIDEELRARLLALLRNPPGGGNWPQFADLAEKSTSSVQKAFIYSAFNGPSTVLVSVTRAATSTNKNRDVAALTLTQTVLPAVAAGIFEGINLQLTTVQNQAIDVSFGLVLPSAITASPPGPGGGWIDGLPFPSPKSGNKYSVVTAVVNSTLFTVESHYAPIVGSSIVYIDKTTWTVVHAKVIAFASAGSELYSVAVDTPCINIAVGNWIFPDAVNMDTYINTILNSFNALGPGQIVDINGLLPYAYRRPLVTLAPWFSDITQTFFKNLINAEEEVFDVQLLYAPTTSPQLPSDVLDGPYILVPNNFGFYPPEILT